jgi:hypothetical protein
MAEGICPLVNCRNLEKGNSKKYCTIHYESVNRKELAQYRIAAEYMASHSRICGLATPTVTPDSSPLPLKSQHSPTFGVTGPTVTPDSSPLPLKSQHDPISSTVTPDSLSLPLKYKYIPSNFQSSETDVFSAESRHLSVPGPVLFRGVRKFYVERIVSSRPRGRGWQFQVRWVGYGPSHDQWLAASKLKGCWALDPWYARGGDGPDKVSVPETPTKPRPSLPRRDANRPPVRMALHTAASIPLTS